MPDAEATSAELQAATAKIRQMVEKYSKASGYPLNPDASIVDTIIEGLARNRLRHGLAYCPCVIVTGDRERDRTITCPCNNHKQDIADNGTCHCALYVSPDFDSPDAADRFPVNGGH